MKKLITMALLAAVAMPAAAQAQSQREIRRDRHDVRQEQRDVERARRNGDPREVRREQRELAGARQELREDRRDRDRRWGNDDWQGWRNGNRGTFARGHWNAPFRYQQFRPGLRISFDLFGPRYRISDPWRYHLPPAGYNQVWVRHYDDLLLVDVRRGIVVRVIRNFYW